MVGEEGAAWVVAGDAFKDFAVSANFGFSFLGFGLLGDGKHFIEQDHELGRGVVVDDRAPQLLAQVVEGGLHLVGTGAQGCHQKVAPVSVDLYAAPHHGHDRA